MSGRHPEVLWAQRRDKVYLTVSLPDAKDVSVSCEPDGLFSFSAVALNGDLFQFSLPLFGPILPHNCNTKVGLRNIVCTLHKQDKLWWNRLLKSDQKPAPYLKVDWNRWCDEDDLQHLSHSSDDDGDSAEYGGEGDESSDEEGMLYLPDLEKARVN